MIKNYLKIAIRNIRKYKSYSAINVFGLSIGVAATIILSLYAYNELTYDAFNAHAEDTYMVYKQRVTPSGTQDAFDTWVPLKDEMIQSFPSVVNGVRLYNNRNWVEIGQEKFQERVTYTDRSLFDVFSFKLANGNTQSPFPDLHSVILSEEIAQKYFGDQGAMGKTIRLNFNQNYVVSGVLEDIPQNSSVQIDIAVLMKSDPSYAEFEQDWGSSFLTTYVRLKDGADKDKMEAKFPEFITKIWDQETTKRTNFKLLPLLEVNNNLNNSFRYAYIHLGIALVIIGIGCINFMNMATARSMDRAKEVGLRKALGAGRGQLIRQFLGEAFILSAISVVLGILIAELTLPYFNSLYNTELALGLFNSVSSWLGVIGLIIVLAILAGSYPAFYLSKFSSRKSLTGTLDKKPKGVGLRHGLVITQFAITVVLIIGTLVVREQVNFMKNADLGFAKENMIAIQVAQDDFDNPEQAALRLETFKNEIKKRNDVLSVTSSENIPGNWASSFTFAIPQGWTDENPMRVRYSFLDDNFFDTYDIEVIEGRNFREGSEVDKQQNIIINKSALKEFGWQTGVGKTIGLGSSGSHKLTVIGVVEDYNFQSLQNPVAPILHVYRQPENGVHNFISVRVNHANLAATLSFLKEKWNGLDPSREINYFFLDENFNQQYRQQEQLVSIASSFSVLAIIIACLGLLALVSLTVQQRKKEIGVRKVLGASTGRILMIISKDYLKLVTIGFVIAVPIAFYLMQKWLANYAYQVHLGVGIFLISGGIALLVSFVVIGIKGAKAALENPVDSLRSE